MRIGQLRHRITLQSKTATQDAYGAETVTWKNEKEVHASVDSLNGREYFLAQQMQSEVTHKIRFRYIPGLTPAWRVKWGTRIFDIKSAINPEEKNSEWILMCKEFLT